MDFRRTRSELASRSNQQRRATGMRTKPSFKKVIMQALGIQYVGLVVKPLVSNLLHDELGRIVPHIINQIEVDVMQKVLGELRNIIPQDMDQTALVMRQQMREERPMDVLAQINAQTNGIVVQQMEPLIAHADPLLRSPRLPIKEAGPAAPKLQLSFQKKLLQSTFFAEDLIKDEDHNNLQVALRQIESGQIYSPPLEFPVEVEIVVVDGEFPSDSSGEWSTEEFNSKILKAREGKKPLLLGAYKARLHEGIASFGGIKLTDSSTLAKSGKFKLGAKVSPSSHVGWEIKPAVTECFKVLVERSKQHQKSYPPSLDDKVFKLENIRLNGEFMKRLAARNITTVKDFLKLAVVDQEHLQKITNMPRRMLNETVEHAKTCNRGEVLYMYSREPFDLILNSICEVQSVNGKPYKHLTPSEQECVKEWVLEAYNKGDNLERFYGNSLRGGELGPSLVSHNMILTGTGPHTNGLEQLPPSHMDNARENSNPFHGRSEASSSRIIGVQQNGNSLSGGELRPSLVSQNMILTGTGPHTNGLEQLPPSHIVRTMLFNTQSIDTFMEFLSDMVPQCVQDNARENSNPFHGRSGASSNRIIGVQQNGNSLSGGELRPSLVSQNMILAGTGLHTNGLEQLPPSHIDNARENSNPFHGRSGASSSRIIGVQQNGNSLRGGELGPSHVSQNMILAGTGPHTNGLEQLPPSHIDNARENWNPLDGSSGASSSGIIRVQQNGNCLSGGELGPSLVSQNIILTGTGPHTNGLEQFPPSHIDNARENWNPLDGSSGALSSGIIRVQQNDNSPNGGELRPSPMSQNMILTGIGPHTNGLEQLPPSHTVRTMLFNTHSIDTFMEFLSDMVPQCVLDNARENWNPLDGSSGASSSRIIGVQQNGNSPSGGELGPSPVSQNMIVTGTGPHTNGLEQLPPSHIDNAQQISNPFHGSSGTSSSGIIQVQQNGMQCVQR
ncbi:uncharacterized protein LOC122041699 isoform X2 [Zingiber officinale]|uniref:uncharacterized protein LOC122041699 isoform X2 n=1 Tax=Zingiber officinale TaxID=94328 RepID=UPI001C4C0692|nr:uncharacterized protein LOC122041699 isoform X2 [Zingiber officinale]